MEQKINLSGNISTNVEIKSQSNAIQKNKLCVLATAVNIASNGKAKIVKVEKL